MKTTQLIELLTDSLKTHGDIPVTLMDGETGNMHPAQALIKLHPYTGPHGCMNREQPVNALGLMRSRNNADDLILGLANVKAHSANNE